VLKAVFVDTSAWYALIDGAEAEHAGIVAALGAHHDRLVTSDYVFDEALTLARYQLGWDVACKLGRELRSGEAARIVSVTATDVGHAWDIFASHSDRRLSFTDCTSFALMKRLRLDTAITLDGDFRQAGYRVLP
jgi:predicted nucleic acid-binding protein